MSEEAKTLKIFEPLKLYFAILCEANCSSNDECDELMNTIARENCDPSAKFTNNFMNALAWFAKELKEADAPIGSYTIRNNLKKIFEQAFNDGKRGDDLVNSITNLVNNADKSFLSGFKMNDDNGEGKSYMELLKNSIDEEKADNIGSIFGSWIKKSFGDLYKKNEKYFDENIKQNILSTKLDSCQKLLLDKYFEIKADEGVYDLTIDEYIKEKEKYEKYSARLNAKPNADKTEALIVSILPKEVREAFNNYLVQPPKEGSPVFYETTECVVKVKISHKEPAKESYKVPNVKNLMDFFKKIALEPSKKMERPKAEYVPDSPDNEKYYDSDKERTAYGWPADFEVKNFSDKWRVDRAGNLYKLDEKTKKFKIYEDKDYEADVAKFDGDNCGGLCIFDDISKCKEFFKDMVNDKKYNMDELSKIINGNDFVRSYKALKKNIVEVNPLFVVGTLKLFGFQKYTQLNDDGTKTIKIESFTRWWNRQNKESNLGDKLKASKEPEYTGTSGVFPGSHPGLTPPAPANLELFFKLLIEFINSNEFVLSPKDKSLVNKSGKPKLDWYNSLKNSPDYLTINGKKVRNKVKDELMKRSSTSNDSKNLFELADEMRKNNLSGLKSINSGIKENALNLSTLLGLMVGVTQGGKIRLSKANTFGTGIGYGSTHLGGGDVDISTPCHTKAMDIFKTGMEKLKSRGIDLKSELKNKIKTELGDLAELEVKLYEQLKILTKYANIVKLLDENNQEVDEAVMESAIDKYNKLSLKVSTKADNTIATLLRNLFEDRSSGSYYSDL